MIDGYLTPKVLKLGADATVAWVTYHDSIEEKLRVGGELYDVRDVAAKSADNAARLAALFHIFNHGIEGDVSLADFDGASRIAVWHLNESIRFFTQIPQTKKQSETAQLDAWLINFCQNNGTNEVSSSKVLQGGPPSLRNKSSLDAAMGNLHELNRARWLTESRSRIIQINPSILIEKIS